MIFIENGTIEQIKLKISEFKKLNNNKNLVLTNFYNNINDNCDVVNIIITDSGITFSFIENSIYRVYFYSINESELATMLDYYPENSIIDFITKDEKTVPENLFEKTNYKRYALFKRESNSSLSKTLRDNIPKYLLEYDNSAYGKFATLEQANVIYDKLNETFDPYLSHITTLLDINKMILKNQIIVEMDGGVLVTVLTYRIEGKKLYMEHLINVGAKQNSHCIYMKTLENAIKSGIDYVYTWVDEKNERVIKFINRYGYKFDGLMDFIYKKG